MRGTSELQKNAMAPIGLRWLCRIFWSFSKKEPQLPFLFSRSVNLCDFLKKYVVTDFNYHCLLSPIRFSVLGCGVWMNTGTTVFSHSSCW